MVSSRRPLVSRRSSNVEPWLRPTGALRRRDVVHSTERSSISSFVGGDRRPARWSRRRPRGGFEPIVVPAAGSHAGATAEGQRTELATLGADEADTVEFDGGEFADPSLDPKTWAAADKPANRRVPAATPRRIASVRSPRHGITWAWTYPPDSTVLRSPNAPPKQFRPRTIDSLAGRTSACLKPNT